MIFLKKNLKNNNNKQTNKQTNKQRQQRLACVFWGGIGLKIAFMNLLFFYFFNKNIKATECYNGPYHFFFVTVLCFLYISVVYFSN